MPGVISHPGLPPATKPDRLRAILARCHDDPARFAKVVLGSPSFEGAANPHGSPFWHRQQDASELVVRYHTAILPWGNSLGKSWWMARIVLWWLCTRRNSIIITTAPTYNQLAGVLWKYIRHAYNHSLLPLGGRLYLSPLSIRFDDHWLAYGISTTKTERMSGHHSEHLMAVVDEASDIAPEIDEAIDSLVPRKVVRIGNPIRAEGRFRADYDKALLQEGDASIPDNERMVQLRVPSTESPDIGVDESRRGMACGSWVRRMERQYGAGSLWMRTHVHAEFPDFSRDALIPPAWLDAAAVRRETPWHTSKKRMAIDLGMGVGADRSCVLVRDDVGIVEVWESNLASFGDVAEKVQALRVKWGVDAGDISWDAMGIGAQFGNDLEARKIYGAVPYFGSASGGPHFTNLRSACAFRLRARLNPDWTVGPAPDSRTGLIVPGPRTRQEPFHLLPGPGEGSEWWPSLREELTALRYELVGQKSKLEAKDLLCKQLGRSPDIGDALIQSFWADS